MTPRSPTTRASSLPPIRRAKESGELGLAILVSDYLQVCSSYSIQNLCQFDSDHVLDVHQARLYPFDTYELTSTLRVTDGDKAPVTIKAMSTVKLTSSFAITPTVVDSYMNSGNVTGPSSDIILKIRRPAEARLFALLLFCTSWMLAHATMIAVVLSAMQGDALRTPQYILFVLVVLLAIPQLRNAMPDAPGFDGKCYTFLNFRRVGPNKPIQGSCSVGLVYWCCKFSSTDRRADSIGFFPQMICTAFAGLLLFISIAHKVLAEIHAHEEEVEEKAKEKALPQPKGLERLRRQGSSVDFRHARRWSSRAGFPGASVPEEIDGF